MDLIFIAITILLFMLDESCVPIIERENKHRTLLQNDTTQFNSIDTLKIK
jgi:hypothetical protein